MSSSAPSQAKNKDDHVVQVSTNEEISDAQRAREDKKKKHDQRGETFLAAFCAVM
jgi:hypothetical protein